MDRLLLHNPGGHLRPHALHYRLRLLQQKYPLSHPDHFYQVNYPVDSAGKMCYLDLPNHPFIYFRQPHNTKV